MSGPDRRTGTLNAVDLLGLPTTNRRLLSAADLLAAGRPIQAIQLWNRVAGTSPAWRPYCTHQARQAMGELLRTTPSPRIRNPRPPQHTPQGLLAWVLAHPARLVELTEATPTAVRLGLLYQQVWDATVWLTLGLEQHARSQEEGLHCLDGHRVGCPGHPPTPLNPRDAQQARLERAVRLKLGLDQLMAWHPWPWLPRLVGLAPEAIMVSSEDLPRHWTEARRITRSHLLEEARRIDWEQERQKHREQALVSVVIPVWGAGQELSSCLEALEQLRGTVPLEILLVDNGNQDPATLAVLEAAPRRDSRVTVLRQSSNFGFALGCNLGFAASRGARTLFLNSDARLASDALAPLLETLDSSDCRAVQPALITPAGKVQCLGIVFGSAGRVGLALHAGADPDRLPREVRDVPAVTAACVLVRAEEFATVHGFDVAFLNGQEDTDLALRLRERFGGICRVAATSKAIHPEGSSPGRYRFIDANRSRLIARWPRPDQRSLERALDRDGMALVGFLPNDRPDRPFWLRSPRPVLRPQPCG